MNENLSKIVADYMEIVAKVLNLLETNFGKINYISAKGSEEVPKRGFLDNQQNTKYSLHGIGITVDFEDSSVVFDFDFHSNNHFGFDAWQLARFTRINPQKYPNLSQLNYDELEDSFQNILDELQNQGKIAFNKAKDRYYPALNRIA